MYGNINSLLENFLSSYRSADTIRSYRYRITDFVRFLSKKCKQFDEVVPADVFEYTGKYLNKATISNKITAIKQFYRYVTNKELNIDFVAPYNFRDDRNLSIDDVQYMMYCSTSLREKLILKTLFETGMRVNELANLQRNDIIRKDGYYLKFVAKGNKNREVHISNELAELLKEYKSGKETIFGIGKRQIERLIKDLGEEAVYRTVTPHCLRHGFATELLNQGVKFEKIKEALGHESIVTTLKYLHTNNNNDTWSINLNMDT